MTPEVRSSRLNWAVFAALGTAWGTSYLFIKIGVETLPPFTLIAGRLGIGTIFLAIVLAIARVPLPRDLATYRRLLFLALINIVIPFTLITWAEQHVASSLAAILNSTVPLFTIVFAAFFLHDEPITVNRLVGLLVGFLGVVVLTSGSLTANVSGESLLGQLALIGSALSYGAGAVYARRASRGLNPMIPAFFQVSIAFVIATTLAIAVDHPWTITLRSDAIFAVGWLGIFGSGFAYLFFYRLIRAWGSTRTSLVAYILPVVGIVAGFLVLGEAIDARLLLGTVLIVGGVALVNSRLGARRLFGRAAPAEVAAGRPD